MNHEIFGGDDDPQYDHIVPVIGIGSNHPLSDTGYYADDEILFSDNGLYPPNKNTHPYYFYKVLTTNPTQKQPHPFITSREIADNPDGNEYSLLNLATVSTNKDQYGNYAIAILGVNDHNGEALPVRVTTDPIYENPAIAEGKSDRPAAMELTLSVTVSNLQPGVEYILYRYDQEDRVPDSDFNAHKANAVCTQKIKIDSGTTWSTSLKISSNMKVFFRAVKA